MLAVAWCSTLHNFHRLASYYIGTGSTRVHNLYGYGKLALDTFVSQRSPSPRSVSGRCSLCQAVYGERLTRTRDPQAVS